MTREAIDAYLRHRAEIVGILDERFYPHWWLEWRISTGQIDLLHNDKAVIGLEVRTYPGGARELHGLFAAGDKAAIRELIDIACEAGRQAGCTVAAIESRPGWSRELKDKGFTVDRVRIVKDLTHGV